MDNVRDYYGLQPYDGSKLDTTGERNLAFLRDNIMSIVDDNINGGVCLDVGCGNGRFNSLIKDKFDTIVCIDPMEQIHPLYDYDNVTFVQCGVNNIHGGEEFDTIFFIGSLYLVNRHYGEKGLRKILGFLKPNGSMLAMDDAKRQSDYGFMDNHKILLTKHEGTVVHIFKK